MGWKRINGQEYYYRSERQGGRVKTTYVGGGILGSLVARLEQSDRQERQLQRKQQRAEREESDNLERVVSEWFSDVQRIADAAMIAAGFHKHKGQWRRKRR
jgi:hypothetical protein